MQLFNPYYVRVTQVLNAIGCTPSLMPMVGFKLLDLRCMKDQTNQNRNEDDSANNKKEWKRLLNKEGENRSMLLSDKTASSAREADEPAPSTAPASLPTTTLTISPTPEVPIAAPRAAQHLPPSSSIQNP